MKRSFNKSKHNPMVLDKILPWALAIAGLVIILPLSTALAVCPYPDDAAQRQCDGQSLSRGSRCERVCQLQQKLIDLDYVLDLDGEYGPETSAAVTEYQQDTSGLTVNGIADPATLRSLGLSVPDTGNPPGNNQQNGPGGNTSAASSGECPEGTRREKPNSFCIPTNGPQDGFAGSKTLNEFIIKVMKFLLYLAGIVAVVFVMIGGYQYVTSAGNEELAEKGKKTLINAIIGTVAVVLAYAIITIVTNTLTK